MPIPGRTRRWSDRVRGTVIVKEPETAVDLPRVCSPGSFKEICFEP